MEDSAQPRSNVLVIIGHPREASFCHAIAEQYSNALDNTHFDVRTLDLSSINFISDIDSHSPNDIELEPAYSTHNMISSGQTI